LAPDRGLPRAGGLAGSYRIDAFKTEHGLPQNTVQCLLQTRDGYLWVGTRFGLARFDVLRFTLFNSANTPAMASDSCLALAEDNEGSLWVATKRGLLRWQDWQFTRFTTADGLGHDQVWALCPSRRGGLWIGTEDGVSFFLNGSFTNYTRTFVSSVELGQFSTRISAL
jgi:ligand-binding sensor domain-containing protein